MKLRVQTWAMVAAVCALALPADAAPHRQHTTFAALFDALARAEPLNHQTIERLTGAKLTMAGNSVFHNFDGRDVQLDDVTIDRIDFREPVPGGGATVGPFLVLHLSHGCVRRGFITARFRDLGGPEINRTDGHGTGTYQAAQTRWGKVSFEVLTRAPDCVSSVVLAAR